MSNLFSLVDRLIVLSLNANLIEETDIQYVRNRILAEFGELSYEETEEATGSLYDTLDALSDLAIQKELIGDTLAEKDIFTSRLMNLFLDKPSVVNAKFFEHYAHSPEEATNYFYAMSQASNYIKMNRIAKNKQFTTPSPYGPIEITINLSKPEKDPKQIAAEKLLASSSYPTCLLCTENEGFEGTLKQPDRANHRMIRLAINDGNWMLQYSPYLYYNEHCILLSANHTPMQVTGETFYTLLGFTKQFPHYFIGSNADLPIVGGSILSHEHYQGGHYTFPMDHATTLFNFIPNEYPNVEGHVLNWPLSTLELTSTSLCDLAECSNMILKLWRNYSDEGLGILSHTGDTPHNTITPICKRQGDKYVMRLVLRNNRTNDEHPLGIFHAHEDVHHIKKENIGLIEVMGLAILPARLLTELETIKAYILSESQDVPPYHKAWADMLKEKYIPDTSLDDYITAALGDKFVQVLEHCGVYKLTDEGLVGLKKFLSNFATL